MFPGSMPITATTILWFRYSKLQVTWLYLYHLAHSICLIIVYLAYNYIQNSFRLLALFTHHFRHLYNHINNHYLSFRTHFPWTSNMSLVDNHTSIVCWSLVAVSWPLTCLSHSYTLLIGGLMMTVLPIFLLQGLYKFDW